MRALEDEQAEEDLKGLIYERAAQHADVSTFKGLLKNVQKKR